MDIPNIEDAMQAIKSQLNEREKVTAVGELLVNPNYHYTRISTTILASYGILLALCLKFTEMSKILVSLEMLAIPFTVLFLLAGVCLVALAVDASMHSTLPPTNALCIVTNQRFLSLYLNNLDLTEIGRKTADLKVYNYDNMMHFQLSSGKRIRMKPIENNSLLGLQADA